MKKKRTFTTMDADGNVYRVKPDGTLEPVSIPPVAPASDEAIEAAAMADADNPPLTAETEARLRRVPRTKTLRRALQLTQAEFARRYHIPLGTLRDWEQGRTEPDQPTRAYLKVIANDPEGICRALQNPLTS